MKKNAIPLYLHPWLWSQGSLTKQLMLLSQGEFRVECRAEYYQSMSLVDSLWLDMPSYHKAWVREVALLGVDGQVWVQAKSIFPILSLQSYARQFQLLKQRPMGHLLFSRHKPSECKRRVLHLESGWTRQNLYTWRNCRFIVQETFLDEFERFILNQ